MFKEILREDKRNANSTTFDLPTALLKSCIYQWALDILSFFFFHYHFTSTGKDSIVTLQAQDNAVRAPQTNSNGNSQVQTPLLWL